MKNLSRKAVAGVLGCEIVSFVLTKIYSCCIYCLFWKIKLMVRFSCRKEYVSYPYAYSIYLHDIFGSVLLHLIL